MFNKKGESKMEQNNTSNRKAQYGIVNDQILIQKICKTLEEAMRRF